MQRPRPKAGKLTRKACRVAIAFFNPRLQLVSEVLAQSEVRGLVRHMLLATSLEEAMDMRDESSSSTWLLLH